MGDVNKEEFSYKRNECEGEVRHTGSVSKEADDVSRPSGTSFATDTDQLFTLSFHTDPRRFERMFEIMFHLRR